MKRVTVLGLLTFLLLSLSIGASAQQVLVIANVADVVKMDPAYVTDTPTSTVAYQIFERLGRYGEDGLVHPRLATSWEVSTDQLVWTLYLREDVLFHDGTPFNAEAVKYSFDRLKDPEMASPGAGDVRNVQEIRVVDEYTVSFRLEHPSAAFMSQVIMSSRAGIVSPTAAKKHGQDFSFHPVGTGPFRFVSWEPDNQVVLERNEGYWGDVPLLHRVIFRPIPEAATQMLELETGGVHLIMRVNPHDLRRVANNPRLQLYSTPHYNARYVFFNVTRPPMDNLYLRQAISHAVPVHDIWKAFFQDLAVPTRGILPTNSWAYHEASTQYPYDPQKALALLAKAGYTEKNRQGFWMKDGEELELELYTPDGRYLMDKEIATVIQQSLQEVGIKVTIRVLEWGAFLAAVDGGTHHFCFIGWNQSTPEPANMYGPQFKSHAIGGWANAMFYENPALDDLLIQGEMEADTQKRRAIYMQVAELIALDAPCIPMHSENLIYAATIKMKGYHHSPVEFNLSTVYLGD